MPASSNAAAGGATLTPGSPRGEFSAIWAEFAAPLRAFLVRRVPPAVDPDDVVQEVFVRVVKHLPTLREADRVEAWLFQIARNALRDTLRARRRRDARTTALDVDVAGPDGWDDQRAAEAELMPCLAPMISRLEEPYRSAIELTALQGLTQTDAAKRAGLSISGMKSRVQRARAQLKAMLLRCCEVEVDTRGAITDYQVRPSSGCAAPRDGERPRRARAGGACTCT
jgi:RNA polymerase sigma-70 factor, ECF subfamily